MQDAEGRLLIIVPASLVLIFLLLYFAFRSLLDVIVILSNVLFSAIGGIWALYLTAPTSASRPRSASCRCSAWRSWTACCSISYFNDLRCAGPAGAARRSCKGRRMRVRPVMMTALTAILGLLPAAFSTAIGAQTQRPLAIVVVGGMMTTLFLTRYLMPVLYSFYGHREPPAGVAHLRTKSALQKCTPHAPREGIPSRGA